MLSWFVDISDTPTVEDMVVSYNQPAQWQQLAALHGDQFEVALPVSACSRLEPSLKRLKCANSGHSTSGLRTPQIDLCCPLGSAQ